MAHLTFVMSGSMASVAQAVGLTGEGLDCPACPLNAGDFVSFPQAPALCFRVTARVFEFAAAAPQWRLVLEPAENPVQKLASGRA